MVEDGMTFKLKNMREITTTELKELQKQGKKLLIDFKARWCAPCKMIIPRLEMMSKDYPNVEFVAIDIDDNMSGVMELGVRSVPTIMIYDGSKVVETSIGVKPDSYYKDVLNKVQEYGK